MSITMEEVQVITGISCAYGVLTSVDPTGLNKRQLAAEERTCKLLAEVMECLSAIGGAPDIDFTDPASLRYLADEIERERRAEDEALEATYRGLSRRVGGLMGDESVGSRVVMR